MFCYLKRLNAAKCGAFMEIMEKTNICGVFVCLFVLLSALSIENGQKINAMPKMAFNQNVLVSMSSATTFQ